MVNHRSFQILIRRCCCVVAMAQVALCCNTAFAQLGVQPWLWSSACVVSSSVQDDTEDLERLAASDVRALVDTLTETAIGAQSASREVRVRALDRLVRLLEIHGPMPTGAAPELLDALARGLVGEPIGRRDPQTDRSNFVQRVSRAIALADGPKKALARLRSMSRICSDYHRSEIALVTLGSLFSLRPGGPSKPGERWALAPALDVLEQLAAAEIEFANHCEIGAVPVHAEDLGPSLTAGMGAVAMDEGADPEVRVVAACCFMRVIEAQDAMNLRLGLTRRGLLCYISPFSVLLSTLAQSDAQQPGNAGFAARVKAIQRFAELRDESFSSEMLGRLVQMLDWLSRECEDPDFGPSMKPVTVWPAEYAPLWSAVAQVVARVAAIAPEHVGWTPVNRCLWVAMVDRDRPRLAAMTTPALAKAWIDARAAVPVAWREECTKAAQAKAAAEAEAKPHAPTASTPPAAPHKEN